MKTLTSSCSGSFLVLLALGASACFVAGNSKSDADADDAGRRPRDHLGAARGVSAVGREGGPEEEELVVVGE